jgi:hypothetical protein
VEIAADGSVLDQNERLDCGQQAFWNRWDSELHIWGRLLKEITVLKE